MDRRNFFKTILSTSLLTPILLASKKADNTSEMEFFVISDNLQDSLPLLLEETTRHRVTPVRTFAFLSSHPQKTALSGILENNGWVRSGDPQQADVTLSYSRLNVPAQVSFTLVTRGEILDIRRGKLARLWQEMARSELAMGMTSITFRGEAASMKPGRGVLVFSEGKRVASLKLDRPTKRMFKTTTGQVLVRIENSSARVAGSSCRNKICMHTHPVSTAGERIICAPNHFMLVVTGDGPVDTIIG